MKEETQQALKEEAKWYVALNNVDCAIHAVNWYRKHIWHDIAEEPDFSKFILLYDEEGGYLSPASRWPFKDMPLFVETMNKKYGANYTKWVYMEDILPDKQEITISYLDNIH